MYRQSQGTAGQGHGAESSPDGAPPMATPPERMQLTADEVRTLRECQRDSFYYRCLPLGFLMIGATQMAVNRGALKPHPRFGGLFKNFGAGVVAYVLGKMSYAGECRKKILKLENSPLADSIRQKKGGPTELFQEMAGPVSEPAELPQTYSQQSGTMDEYRRTDIDTDKNQVHQGLDDIMRPSADSDVKREGAEAKSNFTSHDELRQRNRAAAAERQLGGLPSSSTLPPGVVPVFDRRQQEREQRQSAPPRAASSGNQKNEYGDVWDD